MAEESAVDNASERATAWDSKVTVALALVGTLGMTLVAIAGVTSGPTGPTGSSIERWFLREMPHGTARNALSSVALAVGLALVLGAWVVLGLLLRRGASLRPLIRISVLWSIPLLFGPPLYSRDAYSYAALGRMVNLHWDPYRYGPAVLGRSDFLTPVSAMWRHTPSPYGPLFIRLAGGAVGYSGGSVVTSILLLRLTAVVGVVLIALALPTLAESAGKDSARALWLGVCNPLVLVHFVGGAHNDALMVGLLLCGLAAAVRKHPAVGIALCMCGAAIKAPAALGAAFIAVEAIRQLPAEKRVLGAARLAGVGIATFGAITLVTGIGFGWVKALTVPGQNRILLTPTTFAAHWISAVVGHDELVLSLMRTLGTLATIVLVAFLLWRAPKMGTTRACALALAVVVAFGPIVLPWYALWAVIVLAPVGRRIERGFAILASLVLTIVVEPSGVAMPDIVLNAAVVVLGLVLIAIAWRPVRAWIRRDLAVAIDEYRRGGEAARVLDILRRARPSAVTRVGT